MATETTTNEEYLKVTDVVKITGYSRGSIYRFTRLKLIPHYKIGNNVRFKRSEIEQWIERGKVECWV